MNKDRDPGVKRSTKDGPRWDRSTPLTSWSLSPTTTVETKEDVHSGVRFRPGLYK